MKTYKDRYKPKIPTKKYLICPVQNGHQHISEAYIYTKAERDRHGNYFHKSIDYAVPYGSPVYAAADGYAVAFYHRFAVFNQDMSPRLFNNKPIGNGLGYAIQICHPAEVSGVEGGRYTQYGHLAGFSEEIAKIFLCRESIQFDYQTAIQNYYKGKRKVDSATVNEILMKSKKLSETYPWINQWWGYSTSADWRIRETYHWTPEQLEQLHKEGSPYVKLVKQGDLIGFVGESALFVGKPDYTEGILQKVVIPEKAAQRKWDEPHLHFEEFARKFASPEALVSYKSKNRDPYGIYKSQRQYNSRNQNKDSLFIK
ncbi:MAG: hypothetical protein Fur003_3430 [Candidatus Dojkabacteria bacterium]